MQCDFGLCFLWIVQTLGRSLSVNSNDDKVFNLFGLKSDECTLSSFLPCLVRVLDSATAEKSGGRSLI